MTTQSTPVAVLDLGVSNLGSLRRALREVGAEPIVTAVPILRASRYIIPGVGAFAAGMAALTRGFWWPTVLREIAESKPVLGICLGMQLLATTGTEGDIETEGLDLLPGRVERLGRADPEGVDRIPHVGWNEVLVDKPSPLLEGIPSGRDMYFTHSYALTPRDDADAIAFTPYSGGFTSVVQRGRVFGVQFHPEKSSRAGLQLLRNFVEIS